MSRRRALWVALLLAGTWPARAEGPTAASATLADVAFMAGHWIGGDGGELSEEI
jgi:hypothetical protein